MIGLRRGGGIPSSRYGRKILGFSGVRTWVFTNPKLPRPPKAAEKFWLFFLVQNQDFSGKMTNFGAFWNFTGVRFATFSVLTGVSFGENEISTDVRFRAFFFWAKPDKGRKKTLTPYLVYILGGVSQKLFPWWQCNLRTALTIHCRVSARH